MTGPYAAQMIEALAREAGLVAETRPLVHPVLIGWYAKPEALERFAALVRAAALAEAWQAVEDLTEQVAEHLYGHPREKAIEWAKEDKFDSCARKAEEVLAFPLQSIRAIAATKPESGS
jgi:hypothetical protein